MMPLLRALDRIRDVPVSASVAPVPPPAGGSAHQAAPTPRDNGTPLSGAATSVCNRSRNENSARTGGSRPGA